MSRRKVIRRATSDVGDFTAQLPCHLDNLLAGCSRYTLANGGLVWSDED